MAAGAYDVGNAVLQIVPSFLGLEAAVRREAQKAGRDAGRLFREEFDRASGGSGAPIGPSPQASSRAGAASAGAFATAFRARLEAAQRSLPELQIGAASSAAEQELKELQSQLLALRDAKIGVDIDEAAAAAKVEELRAKLADLGRNSPSVAIRINAAQAAAELQGLQQQVARLDGQNPVITPIVNPAPAVEGLAAVSGGMSLLSLGALSLAPALIQVGAAVTGVMSGIAAGALAAAAGVGVLLLALTPVVKAVILAGKAEESAAQDAKTLADRQAAAAAAADQLAGAQRNLAQAQASAASQERQAARAVEDAERGAADAAKDLIRARLDATESAEDAAQRVVDAERTASRAAEDATRRVADAKQAAADAAEDGAQRIADAEDRLVDAQEQAQDAQERLTRAREDAAAALADLDSKVRHNALNQREANLDLEKAEKQLAFVRQFGSRANARQIEIAQLAVDEAKQRVIDLAQEEKDLGKDRADAASKGVEGTRSVIDAKEAVADADRAAVRAAEDLAKARIEVTKAQAEAERALSRAREDQVRSELDNTDAVTDARKAQVRDREDAARSIERAEQRVADVERGISEARIRQTEQAVANATSIANAQQGVVSANRAVEASARNMAAGTQTATDKAKKAYEDLPPAAQELVDLIRGPMKDGLKELSETASAGLLPGLKDGIVALGPAFPLLLTFVENASTAFGNLFREAGQALTAPFWTDFFGFLNGRIGKDADTFGRIFGNLFKGLAGIFQGFGPVIDQVGQGFLKLSERFAKFGESAAKGENEGFGKFIKFVLDAGPKVATFFGSFASALANVAVALAPIGGLILAAFTGLFDLIGRVNPTVLGAIAAALLTIGVAMRVAAIATAAWNAVMVFLAGTLTVTPIGAIIIGILALAAALIYVFTQSETLRRGFGIVMRAIGNAVAETAKFIAARFMDVVGFFRNLPGRVAGFGRGIFDGVRNAAADAARWVRDRITDIISFVRGIPARIGNIGANAFSGLRNAAVTVKNGAVAAFNGIVSAVQSIPGRIAGAFRNLASLITAPFRAAFQGVKNLWNNTLGGKGFHIGGRFGIPDFGFTIPRLARGGTARAGRPHYVGEEGTELFVPGVTGTVVPHGQLMAALGEARLFDSGGFLPTGLSLAMNNTRSPEPILTAGQWDAIMARTSGGDGTSGPLVAIGEFHATPDQSPHRIAVELAWLARATG